MDTFIVDSFVLQEFYDFPLSVYLIIESDCLKTFDVVYKRSFWSYWNCHCSCYNFSYGANGVINSLLGLEMAFLGSTSD